LGGGFVRGGVVLFAGDPGIGKSTLLLQIAGHVGHRHKVLYVSGEESKQQVSLRAQRLAVVAENIWIDSEQNVAAIENRLAQGDHQFVVIDSIQAVFHPEISSASGSVSQTRESAAVLLNAAKAKNIPAILVGHVTKDGTIAGPRVLEHMVDVVLHFEGDRSRQLRVLRAVKNRFGSTQEIAIFSMNESGLSEVRNPSLLFLGHRLARNANERAPSGTCVIATMEGNRPLILEVQSLVGATAYNSPRRTATGFELNRLLQIIAVLEKRLGLGLARQDVYVNMVGGFETSDPAADLGVAVAAATSYMDRSIDPFLFCAGEIGLSGEVRPVGSLERRLREAARMGFRRALVPAANLPLPSPVDNLELIGVEYLVEALSQVVAGFKPGSAQGKDGGRAASERAVPGERATPGEGRDMVEADFEDFGAI
jgi:DNA repair protein RadA/Sms